MDSETIVKELAEEIRFNTRLRHRIGMEEGDRAEVQDGGESILIDTNHGTETFFVTVDTP